MASFALAPMPTLALWISDGLSGFWTNSFEGAALWRQRRAYSPRWFRKTMAVLDLMILSLASVALAFLGWRIAR